MKHIFILPFLFTLYLFCEPATVGAQADNKAWFEASKKGNLEEIKHQRIEKKIDINAKDKKGITALMWASKEGHLETVKYLLEKGGEINGKDNEGMTPLMWASVGGSLEVVKFLVEKGAGMEDNGCRSTPLLIASARGHLEIVKYLVEKGAKLDTVSLSGYSALGYAIKFKKYKIAEYLKSKGAKKIVPNNE